VEPVDDTSSVDWHWVVILTVVVIVLIANVFLSEFVADHLLGPLAAPFIGIWRRLEERRRQRALRKLPPGIPPPPPPIR
jgi:hypothetical protein